jgi:predicted PurR-regulated permease PerM
MTDQGNYADRTSKRPRPVILPRWLRAMALYGICILIIAGVFWVLARVASTLYPVVLAIAVAALLSALLSPIVEWQHRRRLPRWLSTLVAVLAGVALVIGALMLVGFAIADEAAALVDRASTGVREIRDWLVDGPLNLSPEQLDAIGKEAGDQARALGPTSLRGATTILEVLASAVLAMVLLFFMLMDGPDAWRWALGGVAESERDRVDRAGRAGWRTLTGYVRGIVIVAAIDAIGIGAALYLIGVPLALPLAALTFFFCFVPILGATVAGAICVLVALAANGPGDALLVLLAVIIVQQAEGNLLEPLIMGRTLRLHPAVILLSVSTGTLIAGIAGALLSVPLVAVAYRMFLSFQANPNPTPLRPPLGRRMPPDAEARPTP